MDNEADLQRAREKNAVDLQKAALKGKAIGKNKSGQIVDAEGNVVTDQGRIIGVDPFNQQHVDPYEQRKQQLRLEKVKGGLTYSEGLSKVLPVANISIGDRKLDYAATVELTNQLNYLDQNGYKAFNTKFYDGKNHTILKETVDLLKSKGYNVSYNNPQEIREALSNYTQKSVDQSFMTPEQKVAFNEGKRDLAQGNMILDSAYSKLKETDDIVQNYINSFSAQEKYGKILVSNGNGGKEVITPEKISKHLSGITTVDGKTLSAKDLAQAYFNGKLSIKDSNSTGSVWDAISSSVTAGGTGQSVVKGARITIGDRTYDLPIQSRNKIVALFQQFGKPEQFSQNVKDLKSEAFKGTLYNIQDGETGQIVSYTTGTKSPENNAKVQAILGNPGNIDGYVDSKGNPIGEDGSFSDLLSNITTSDVASFNYGNGRSGYFQLKPAALTRLEKLGFGEQAAALNRGEIRFRIGENTTAEALQDLPVAQRTSLDRRLLEGKTVTQSPDMEQEGFRYQIIPDNAGSKGVPNNVTVVVQVGKKGSDGKSAWEPESKVGTFNLTQYPFENLRDVLFNRYADFLTRSSQQYATEYAKAGPAGTMTLSEIKNLKQ